MVLTPSGPRAAIAWWMRSVLPQLSMRKPRSWLNFSVAARASSLRKELKQHSGLRRKTGVCERGRVWTLCPDTASHGAVTQLCPAGVRQADGVGGEDWEWPAEQQ